MIGKTDSPAHPLYADAHQPLTPAQAVVEADRCYFCHDAPCVEACPTTIDVPRFIRGIATGNLRGAALTIFEENIFGGACARVCPTEVLCEQACVRNAAEDRPIRIGALQRHATDWLMAHDPAPFARALPVPGRVAVVGAGPAGLSCAHRLALLGHQVMVFEAKPKPGGLNEYGVAPYKMADDFAQSEAAFVLSVGGIEVEYDCHLGRDISLATLRADHDAVFLACGQAGARALAIEGEALPGVVDAVAFIAGLRQATDPATLAVGRRVVVIGGGNTAVDASVQASMLGAEMVTIAYRRGPETMSATAKEQSWARANGVTILHWARPTALLAGLSGVTGVAFQHARTGEAFTLAADLVLKAVGQILVPEPARGVAVGAARILVDAEGRTSLPGVYAGGDCTPGKDLTVVAVQDGKVAAEAIHRDLMEAAWPI
jgi:dihydropyrimidine dehydrogenase (NAD+) subunit PreT